MKRRPILDFLEKETDNLREAGLLRPPFELSGAQGPKLKVTVGTITAELTSFASSDYFGLAVDPDVKRAVAEAVETWGVGVASTRPAVGTLAIHRELERAVAAFVGAEDAIVLATGYQANTGVFEALVGDRDFVFCDEMVKPSVADGIRISRARVFVYRHDDMEHLEDRLKRSGAARFRVIATDGFFPMTGRVARLLEIHRLAEKYDAIVVADDSHGVGVLGRRRGGAHALLDLESRIDVLTGSFGNALGGGAGGFVAGKKPIVEWLRQKSRPYLASTALDPASAAAALASIGVIRERGADLARTLDENLATFRDAMARDAGLEIDVTHPAVSIRIGSAIAAQRVVDHLFRSGIFVLGYCHPVVPEGQARISARVTTRHQADDVQALARAIGEGMRAHKVTV